VERRSRVLLILLVVIGLAFLLTGCLKKIDVTLTVAIQGLGETDPDVGAHVFKYGTTVTLTATPAEGYDFEEWEVEGLGSFNESVKEIKLKDSILATAFFAKKSFNIEASVDPENGGTVTGAGSYLFGDTASLTAVAAEGFKFVEWTENGAPIGSDNPLEFVVNANRAFVAHFANEYMVTVNVIPEEGGMASGGGKYIFGSEITVVATPADCYDFDGWFVGETLVSENAEYTFTVTEDVDLVAVFTLKTFEVTVTAEPEEGGVVSGGGTYDCGSEITVVATPADCYDFDGWFVGETLVSENAEYTFTVTEDVDLVAVFTLKTFEVTVTAEPEEGGVVSGGGTYDCGSEITVVATPADCYDFVGWFIDPLTVPYPFFDSEYVFTVTEDINLVAKFTLKTFEVVATAGENGTITPDGTQTVECGDDITFAIVPDDCYYILDVLVDGESVGAVETYTFENVRDDHTIEALFEKFTYEVVATAGENGTITPDGTQTVECGDDILFTFTPDEGYGVDMVTVDGAPVTPEGATDTTDKTYKLENVRDDHDINATFKEVFKKSDFNFIQYIFGFGDQYDFDVELDDEVTLISFHYLDNPNPTVPPETPVVNGIPQITTVFVAKDTTQLLVKAFTANGDLLAEKIVELDNTTSYVKQADFSPLYESPLAPDIFTTTYDAQVLVDPDQVDQVELAYLDSVAAVPQLPAPDPAGQINALWLSPDMNASLLGVSARKAGVLKAVANVPLLKVIEASIVFVRSIEIGGIKIADEYRVVVAINSPNVNELRFSAPKVAGEDDPFLVKEDGGANLPSVEIGGQLVYSFDVLDTGVYSFLVRTDKPEFTGFQLLAMGLLSQSGDGVAAFRGLQLP